MPGGQTADLDGAKLALQARWQPQFGDPLIDAVRYLHAPALNLVSHRETGVAVLTNSGAKLGDALTAAARDIGPAMLTVPRAAGSILDGTIAGRRLARHRQPAGTLAYLPRDADYRLAYAGSLGFFNLVFPDGWLEAQLDPVGGIAPVPIAVDGAACQIARHIADEICNPGPASRLLVEGLSRALAVHLRRLDGTAPPAAAGRIHISPLRLRRVTSFIDDHLAADFGLAELAEVAGLSPFHFTRVFKRATGLTPWAFVRQRRLELARQLLATSELPIATVAARCGYASLGRFSTSFGRFSGLSPGRYRREVRGLAA